MQNKLSKYRNYLLLLFIAIFLSSCEQNFDIKLPTATDQIVVEGYIEQGLPPIVILTHSSPFLSKVDAKDISAYFVHQAEVKMTDDEGNTYPLYEVASDTLPAMYASLLNMQLSHDSTASQTYYFYTMRFSNLVLGKIKHTYKLDIKASGHTLHAETTIPGHVPLDSAWWQAFQDPRKADYAQLMARIKDPDTLGNRFRYFTQRQHEPYYPGYNSVFEDTYTNGKDFNFPLPRGQSPIAKIDPATFGLFSRGDTITLKWCAIDEATFKFWRSAEIQLTSSANPFSPLVRVNSNVQGGLGIWAGYAASYYHVVIPK